MLATVRSFSVNFLCLKGSYLSNQNHCAPSAILSIPHWIGKARASLSGSSLSKGWQACQGDSDKPCGPVQSRISPVRRKSIFLPGRSLQEHTHCASSPTGCCTALGKYKTPPSSTRAAAGLRDHNKQQEEKQRIRWKFRSTFKKEKNLLGKRFPTHTLSVYPLI